MKIAIASDHAGYRLKVHLLDYLLAQGHEVVDLGVDSDQTRSDYPDVAEVIARSLLAGEAERGLLLCGSGVGACIAANKFTGIYACVCHDTYSARQGVEHDNMNVLALGARIIGVNLAETLVDAFLSAEFSTVDRYRARFEKVQAFEQARSGE